MADGLADLTMDLCRTWEKSFAPSLEIASSNLIVQTDGGCRAQDCAAAAWIIGLWGDDGEGFRYEPLMVHGTFLDASTTVFAAEAIALDEATQKLQQFIKETSELE